jgi:hypothetical protein
MHLMKLLGPMVALDHHTEFLKRAANRAADNAEHAV